MVVARHGADAANVAKALKEHDPDLRLIPQYSQDSGQYWAVYQYHGPDRPASFVLAWIDPVTREPLPLSHGIVERVKQRDRNSRGDHLSADEANAQRAAQEAKERDELAMEIAEEHARSAKTKTLLPRTRSWGNRRWKEEQYQAQQQRLRETR